MVEELPGESEPYRYGNADVTVMPSFTKQWKYNPKVLKRGGTMRVRRWKPEKQM